MAHTSIPPVDAHSKTRQLHVRWPKSTTIAAVVVVTICMVVMFAGFFAPYSFSVSSVQRRNMPPQRLHFLDSTATGKHLRLHTYGYSSQRDLQTLRRSYQRDLNQKIYVGLFVRGEPYTTLFGLIESELYLFGPIMPGEPVHLLGTDSVGRDVLSGMILGMRNSLVYWSSIVLSSGIVALLLSLTLQRFLKGTGWNSQYITTLIQSIPTWVFRLLLLGLLSWHWPLLSLFLRSLVWQRTIIPETMPAIGPAFVTFVVIALLTLLLHRSFLLWLTLMWTGLAIWKLSSLRTLAGWIGGYDGVEFMRSRMAAISLLGEFGMILLLLLSIVPGMLLVIYGIVTVHSKNHFLVNTGDTQVQWLPERWPAPLLSVFAFILAMIPMLYPLQTSFFNYGLEFGQYPTLRILFGDLSNLLQWEQAPWMLWNTMPALLLLWGFVLLADALFYRVQHNR